MKVVFFSSQVYDTTSMQKAATELNIANDHEFVFYKESLRLETAVLAKDAEAVVIFIYDTADATVLRTLYDYGVRLVLLRCSGWQMVEKSCLPTLKDLQIARVPNYSPYAVAEHAVGLMLSLNRHIPRAFNRTREFNFHLNGFLGFDMNGKTIGIIGLGEIGTVLARICVGFGMKVLANDVVLKPELEKELDIEYVSLPEIWERSHIISLHCPLNIETRHIINAQAIKKMKKDVMIINTSSGDLVDTEALVEGLKARKIGHVGLDVYEEEEAIFNKDNSGEVMSDDKFARFMTFPNVIITGHQAYFTEDALNKIALRTMENLTNYANKKPLVNTL